MSVHSPTEALVEDVTAVYFGVIGAQIRRGVEIDDASERLDSGQCVLQGRLSAALHRLNPVLPHEVIEGVVRTLAHPPHPTLVQNNRWLHRLLSNGVEVEYRDPRTRETRGGRCRLMDFDDPLANDLLVVRQLAVTGPSGKLIRLDLVVFLNGLPIVVIELKDPTNPHADLTVAIEQLDRYQATVPDLFVANLVRVVSDGMLTRVGSITSDRSRFMPWRPLADDGCGAPTLEAMIRGLFEPRALLDYLRTCVAFEEDAHGEIVKKIAGYHQFRAVRRARTSVLAHLRPAADGRGGVIWHTQGSGKSLTMLMLAGALIREPDLANPTRVLITDRNDLDDQLFDTFAAGRALLRQDPMQATSRDRLRDLLDLLDRAAGGVVFTTIHKFAEAHGVISERANVVVLADEAHRSQYGFVEGGARWMREALPNATFVGFSDYARALDAAPRDVLPVYLAAIDHVLGQDDGWKRFRTLVKELATAFALAVPRPETDLIAPHLAFFQRAAAMIRKRLADDGKGPDSRARQRDIDAAVRQVIGGAVDADEVIDLFAVAGLDEARLDILSDEFLERVAALEQKNLALETLRKLLNDQIRSTERSNLVRSRKFREALEDALLRYTNKAITTAEMIARLIDLARDLREAQRQGDALGLSTEEIAFYDALAENASAREVMQSDALRLMARELTEMVRRMPKLDWTQRESVRATLRRNVRRLLAKYGYPPDLAEGATQLVLRQAELSTEDFVE